MKEIVNDDQIKILKEQFIPDNVFLYIVKGSVNLIDGNNDYILNTGECCILKKNNLLKFILLDSEQGFEPVIFCFDEPFLRLFMEKHKIKSSGVKTEDAVIKIQNTLMLEDFILSLRPYYKGVMKLDETFEDLKYEELLIILLKNQPGLVPSLFDFRQPEKINLEAFMNKNFKFNVGISRLAYLTGRSLSAFKRDFKTVFNETPGRWLVKKRLQEAYFLIDKEKRNPSDIYLDLGFETLSHFSYAFKNMYGVPPSKLSVNS